MVIQEILSAFFPTAQNVVVEPIVKGLINRTFDVGFTLGGEKKRTVVQRINKTVFTQPQKVMDNIEIVTNYLQNGKGVMTALSCNYADGKPYVVDDEGEFWRCVNYIDGVSLDKADANVAYETGKAFGEFQLCLDGFPAEKLFETIPRFHDACFRYENLLAAIKGCEQTQRLEQMQSEIDFLLCERNRAETLTRLLIQQKIPSRVTHNDAKSNNVLFDPLTKKALAVVDLDTVMAGATGFDFGDGARSLCNFVAEDEKDVSAVGLDLNLFEGWTKGFMSKAQNILTEQEKETLALSVFCLTSELAARFLTDYFRGDVYFRIDYPEHNAVRVKNQVALAKDVLRKLDAMQKLVG